MSHRLDVRSPSDTPKRHGTTETAVPPKRAVAQPFIFGGEFEFRFTGHAYFAVVSARICFWCVSVVRNACTVRPVQNDAMRVRQTTDVQDEAVGVCCYPCQIAQIVVAEMDLSPHHLTSINFSRAARKTRPQAPKLKSA
jgi:hypothetical protein